MDVPILKAVHTEDREESRRHKETSVIGHRSGNRVASSMRVVYLLY